MDNPIKLGKNEIKLGVACNYMGCSDKQVTLHQTISNKEIKVVFRPGESCSTPCGMTLFADDAPLVSTYLFAACVGSVAERAVSMLSFLKLLLSDEELLDQLPTEYQETHYQAIKIMNILVSDKFARATG